MTTTDANGKSVDSLAVYLRRGRVLLGVYFSKPDGEQPPIDGRTKPADIVSGFATRIAQLPASFVADPPLLTGKQAVAGEHAVDRPSRAVHRALRALGFDLARRRQAAHAYQVVTTALMTGATRRGQGMAPQLEETRTVLLGYTNQLALEAAAERQRTGAKPRRR